MERWRRALRWVRRFVLTSLALVVLALAAAIIAIHTDWGRDKLRGKVERTLAASFPGGVKIGKLEGSVFGELVVHDIELDAPDHTPELTVGTARIELALTPLLDKTARVDRLVLEDVVVHVPAAQPEAKPSPSPPAKEQPSAWSVELPSIVLHRGRIVKGALAIDQLELAGSASVRGGAIGSIVTASGAIEGKQVTASAVARYQDGVATVPFLAAFSAGAHVAAIGVRVSSDKTVEGRIEGAVPEAAALAWSGFAAPGDATFSLDARRGGFGDARAQLGERDARAVVQVELAGPSIKGVVSVDDPHGTAVAAVVASPEGIRGVVSTFAENTELAIAVDALPSGGFLIAGGHARGARGGLFAEVAHKAQAWQVVRSQLVAHGRDLGGTRGLIEARLSATGRASPDPDLRLEGSLDGTAMVFGDVSIASAHAAIDVRDVPAHPRGYGHVDASHVANKGVELGSGNIDASGSAPKGGPIDIAIDAHQIATVKAGTWSGNGGELVIDDKRIVLRGLATSDGAGKLEVDASQQRATGDLAAKLVATELALATFAPGTDGTVSGSIDVERRGGDWSGGGDVEGHGLVIGGRKVDGGARLRIAGRHITASGSTTGGYGDGSIALDLEGPRALTEAAAWRRLDRRAIRDASITIGRIDSAALGATGALDGSLGIGPDDARGAMRITGVKTRAGELDGTLALAGGPAGQITATLTGTLAGLVGGTATAHLELPAHPFDPAAWRALGRGVLHDASFRGDDFAFDPAALAKLGVAVPYRGTLSAKLDVQTGASAATASVVVRDVKGGSIVVPAVVELAASYDAKTGVTGTLTASAGGSTLAQLDAHAPVTLDTRDVRRVPLAGTFTIPAVKARQLLAVFGRSDVTDGELSGTITFAGTIGTPTAHAAIAAHDITVPAGIAGRPASKLTSLALDATWGGSGGKLALDGAEAAGGTLHLGASGRPDVGSSVMFSLDAKNFDLAPLAAFAPGALVAGNGTLEASLAIHGIDPATGDARGELHLHDARIPLSPAVGTLHGAKLDVTIASHAVAATFHSKLGGGDVSGTAKLALAGATPSTAELDLVVAKIVSTAAVQPTISATIHATGRHTAAGWIADVAVNHGHVTIPSTQRTPLLAAGPPADIQFVDGPPPAAKPHHVEIARPWLTANVAIGPTQVDAENIRDVVSGHVTVGGSLAITVGGGELDVHGKIEHQLGDVNVLGRVYQVDYATIAFDGGFADPELNIRLSHEFTETTLYADITGLVSQRDLKLHSDSSIYTEGDLWGFFLGGEPGGDPSTASRDAAAGAAASVFSTKAGMQLKKVLPIRIDVLSYEASTSSSSEAVRAGRWLGRKLYFEYRGHPEARPDENANEGAIEYYLPDNWFLQGTAGDRDIYGADLLHRWRW